MYITNLCSFYQHNVNSAQKSKWLSPNKRKYAHESKVKKFGIDTVTHSSYCLCLTSSSIPQLLSTFAAFCLGA